MQVTSPRALESRLIGVLASIGPLVAVCLAVGSAVQFGGGTWLEGLRVAAVCFLQSLLGVGLWTLARGRGKASAAELVGMSLVIGPVLFSALSLIAASFDLTLGREPSWIFLCLFGTVGLLLVMREPLRRCQSQLSDWLILIAAPVLALIVSLTYWNYVQLPRNISGWGTLSGDVAASEAQANSLAAFGISDYLLASGITFRYHWLSQAWIGFSQVLIDASSFVVTTRALPMLSITAGLILCWVWIRVLARASTPAWFAVAATLAVGIGSIGSVFVPGSTSQTFVVPLVLSCLIAWTHIQRGGLRWASVCLVSLTIGMVLTKSTALIVPLAMTAASVFVSGRERMRTFRASAISLVFGGLAILSFSAGYGNSLTLSLTQSIAYMQLELPWSGATAVALGMFGVILFFASIWAPTLNLAFHAKSHLRPTLLAGGLAGASSVLFILFTGQWGQSQFYFAATASVVLVPLVGWGIWIGKDSLAPKGFVVLTILTVIVGWALVELGLVDGPSWSTTIVILVLAIVSAGVFGRVTRDKWSVEAATAASTIAVFLLTAVIALDGFAEWVVGGVTGNPVTSVSSNSISVDQIAAIDWLEMRNTERALVASNFVCNNPDEAPPSCISIQFPVSALGNQPMWLEGYSYAVGNTPPDWATDRLVTVEEMLRDPSQELFEKLEGAGVRWMFVDKRRVQRTDWTPYACTRYETANAAVLELTGQGC